MGEVNIFVGRQPILDRNGNIYAYELLYRNSENNHFPANVDPEQATIRLLVNTFLSIGMDQIAPDSLAFINFSGKLLAQDIFTKLDPNQVVIEILEDVEITPALLTRLRTFKTAGFKLALDDFVLQDQYLDQQQLFELIDIVKVDFLQADEALRQRIQYFMKAYPAIRLLAEKIETEEAFHSAMKQGYHLFQGYFFAKPEIIKSADIPTNVVLHFQIMRELRKEMPNLQCIADLIMRDVSLSYKLLRFINSLAFDIPKQIQSIKQALVLIGLKEIRKWLQVLTLHEMGTAEESGRIKALVQYSLQRAKFCELLAKAKRQKNTDEYFLAGMFSLIDAIMRRKWEDILPLLALTDVVADTLVGEQTSITPYLQLAIAIERFDWEKVQELAELIGISEEELSRLTLKAHKWTQGIE